MAVASSLEELDKDVFKNAHHCVAVSASDSPEGRSRYLNFVGRQVVSLSRKGRVVVVVFY